MIRNPSFSFLAVVSIAAVSACATTPMTMKTPDYTPIQPTPSAKARLYAGCIAQAAAAQRYGYAHDGLDVIVFRCEGAPAQAFFDVLGPWTRDAGSEVTIDGRTIRPTTRVERDLFAVDYCEKSGAAVQCVITLRTGEFIRP